ncbi:protein of unknown function DUF1217 [Methylocella silvestris BL2]|uniref:DUF1217 domain-containing protein n=1 Tax=Methylocella silvestris (strain DSM 15510 / CIP 108128 / LMG 27833 / NCIMB 13906 / BL2) TaxID=395965 RepID=B8EK63_METSB|nr:DUF1217 domain-containing protein [Methylocella silvestris]ACK50603.1 protein of unknown function DUF1217 [Methylocella silvestris BL2]
MLNSTLYYTMLTRDFSKSLATAASDTVAKRETAYYEANIGKVKSVDDLMKNQRLYAYVLKAYGLSDMAYAKGLIRKVLTSDVTDGASLANTLSGGRYKALAAAYNFSAKGAVGTISAEAQKTTKDNYVEQTLEANVGKQNDGAKMALYFKRIAPTVKSAYGILADKTLLGVVQTAFGLSASMSQQNIDVQAKTINALFKIGDLQNPAKLQKLIQRFTANYDAQHPMGVSMTPSSALEVSTPDISQSLLMSLANLKLGGS